MEDSLLRSGRNRSAEEDRSSSSSLPPTLQLLSSLTAAADGDFIRLRPSCIGHSTAAGAAAAAAAAAVDLPWSGTEGLPLSPCPSSSSDPLR